ncbi:HsdM family class I SAM-dependent methyltransferase [Saccharopolyspora sp. 5N708]|uniref:HsdM family class I SAM-dependent methyltransferase n=1 Tax=Saccharopolyspora sp. 5N708 TaxID=3457424 RepID=UPI003FD1711A
MSNWRRRHADFPAPAGGTDTSPAYDLDEVREWLAARGQLPGSSPADELRVVLCTNPDAALVLAELVPSLARADAKWLAELHEMPEATLVGDLANRIGASAVLDVDVKSLRALAHCVAEDGGRATVEVFREVLVPDTAGAYATPQPVAGLMANLASDYPECVFDPACGAGGLLSAAAGRGANRLYGQDVNDVQATLAEVRLKVESVGDAAVASGDSLRADAFPDALVDTVLCNPPFGVRNWGHDDLAYDPRWVYGLPPRSESELAWVQHCLAHLEPGGLAVVLMPPGAAERSSGRRVRAELIRQGALRAVIGLPPGAAQPFHLSLHIWVLTCPDEALATGKSVLFVDASSGNVSDQRIVELWRDFDEAEDRFEVVPDVAQRLSAVDLLDATVDVTPARRVHTRTVISPAGQADFAEELRKRLGHACDELAGLASAPTIASKQRSDTPTTAAWSVAEGEPMTWRTATVADLLRGGALTLYRATPTQRTGSTRNSDVDSSDVPRLTLSDLRGESRPSGSLRDKPVEPIRIERGDVIMPETLQGLKSVPARVAGGDDTGKLLGAHLFLLRPDPERLDSWFLAGFLSADENTHRATTGSSIVRLDVKRLRVPLMPPERQLDYGRAFRHLHATRRAAALANELAAETARQWTTGLTSGALLPPEDQP